MFSIPKAHTINLKFCFSPSVVLMGLINQFCLLVYNKIYLRILMCFRNGSVNNLLCHPSMRTSVRTPTLTSKSWPADYNLVRGVGDRGSLRFAVHQLLTLVSSRFREPFSKYKMELAHAFNPSTHRM